MTSPAIRGACSFSRIAQRNPQEASWMFIRYPTSCPVPWLKLMPRLHAGILARTSRLYPVVPSRNTACARLKLHCNTVVKSSFICCVSSPNAKVRLISVEPSKYPPPVSVRNNPFCVRGTSVSGVGS